MEQLSSCYFCGAALDAQIEPYQVVPPQLEPTSDQQRAVALCPSCRQKLAHVVETVVEATDVATDPAVDDVPSVEPADDLLPDDETTTEPSGPHSGASSTGESDGTTTETGTDGPTETGTESGREPAPHGSSQSAAGDDTSIADVQDMSGRGDTVETADRTERETADQSGRDTDDPLSTTQTSTSDPVDDETAGDHIMANGTDETPTAESPPDRTETAETTEAAPTTETTEATPDDSTTADTATDDGPTLTALEYNKVMRLLQNREFPVERAEIQGIATNAYQISQHEFDAIIDAAIERGLLGEENGQLVSADD